MISPKQSHKKQNLHVYNKTNSAAYLGIAFENFLNRNINAFEKRFYEDAKNIYILLLYMSFLYVSERQDLTWALCIKQFIKCVTENGKIILLSSISSFFPEFISAA